MTLITKSRITFFFTFFFPSFSFYIFLKYPTVRRRGIETIIALRQTILTLLNIFPIYCRRVYDGNDGVMDT